MTVHYTYTEITSQTAAWENALAVSLAQASALKTLTGRYDQVIFTGCGSTYYLSLAGAALYQSLTGVTARAVPAANLLLNTATVMAKEHVTCWWPSAVPAQPPSGQGGRKVQARRAWRGGRDQQLRYHPVAVCGCKPDHPCGTGTIDCQTRSFASMYVATTALCAIAAAPGPAGGHVQPATGGQQLLSQYEGLARQIGENLDFDRFYFLGSGIRYGWLRGQP
jgi:glucosamine--fructose-6-phosphate aminotransferase (isomerizing)